MRTTTCLLVIVALTGATLSSSCIKKEEKEEENKGGPPPPPPPPPPEPARSAMAIDQNAKYLVVANAAGKCVQFAGRSADKEQANAEIAACDKSQAQTFKLQPAAGNYWRFINLLSGKCMDVQAVSSDDGAIIQQFTCNGGPNQDWIVADAGPAGVVRLVARNSGKVLDVKGAGGTDGTPLIQMSWHSGANQQFKLVSAEAAPAEKAPAGTGAGGAPGGKAKKEKGGKTKT